MRLSRERIGASGNMDVGGARRTVGPGLRPGLRRSSPAGIAVRCRQNFRQIKSELRSDKFRTAVKCGQILHIYGDFSGSRLAAWDAAIQSLAILQHQQRNNTKGKNAADIALVIGAMDLLHKNRLDGVCLVSSDSDFTRLAQRLREDGLAVYGFGERKTPEAFRNACSRFIYLENILEAEPEKGGAATGAARRRKKPPKKAVTIIVKAMEDGDDDGWVHLGTVGSRIQAAAPDFDPRTYGCANLSTLVEKSGGFELVRKGSGNAIHIRRKADAGGTAGKAAPAKGGKASAPGAR